MEEVISFGGYGQVGPAECSEGDIGELDSATVQYLVEGGVADARLAFPRGGAMPGFAGMYVRRATARGEGNDSLVTVEGHGLLAGGASKTKRTMSAAGRIISLGPVADVVLAWPDDENVEDPDGDETVAKRRIPKVDSDGEEVNRIIVTNTGSQERWNVNEAVLQVEDVYYTTSEPPMDVVATPQTPASAPNPPPYRWSGYTEALRYNDPAGWVLDDRVPEVIVPGALWRVTDRYAYYYTGQPD